MAVSYGGGVRVVARGGRDRLQIVDVGGSHCADRWGVAPVAGGDWWGASRVAGATSSVARFRPPATNCPEAVALRNESAVAALLPVNPAEAKVAARHITHSEYAMHCFRRSVQPGISTRCQWALPGKPGSEGLDWVGCWVPWRDYIR